MTYLSVQEASQKYSKADKTVRRLLSNKTLSRSQAYRNKKNQWKLNSTWLDTIWLTQAPPEQPEPRQSTGHTPVDSETLSLLKDTLKTLQSQLVVKDQQLAKLDNKLDQQQKLTAQLQTQILIASPLEPTRANETSQPIKDKSKLKKPNSKPVKPSSDTKKASKPNKKRWWSRKK